MTRHTGKRISRNRALVLAAAGMGMGMLLPANASAGPLNWDTSDGAGLQAGVGTWSTSAGNWNTSAAPGDGGRSSWVANSDAYFKTNGTSTVTVSGTVNVSSIVFDGTGYTIGGTTLTLTGTGGNITANQDATINAPIGGSVGLTKLGTATLTLSGANTYTGTTTISAGVLSVSNIVVSSGSSNLGNATSVVTLGSAGAQGTLSYTGNTATYTRGFNIGGDGGGRLNVTTSGQTLTVGTNGVTGSGLFTVGGAGNTTISAVVGHTGGLTKEDDGTLTLSNAANSYTGATTISGGTLRIGNGGTTGALSTSSAITNNGTLTFNRTNTVTQGTDFSSAAISGSGALIQGGSGTLVLNVGNTYTGKTTISAGVLNIQNGSALGGTTNGTSVTSGAALEIQGGISVGAEALTLNSTGVSSGGALRNRSDSNTYQGLITLGSHSRINSDAGTLTLDPASGNAITGTFNLTLGGDGNGAVNDPIATGTGTLTKDGSGTWTLSGANTYSGKTTISAGTLSINSILNVGAGNNSAVGAPTSTDNGIIAIGSSTTAGTLSYTGSDNTTNRVIDLAGTTGGATLDQSGTGLLKFTSAFTATGAGSKTLTLSGSTAGTGEIAGAIVNNSSDNKTSVTKTGSGTWTLSGTNTYTGTTTVNAGTLVVSGALDTRTSTVTVNDTGTLSGTGAIRRPVSLTGGTTGATLSSTGTLTLGSTLDVSGTGNAISSGTVSVADLTTVNSGGALAVNGTLGGSGGVSVSGTLKGTGTINNPVVINNGGTLAPGNSIGTLKIGSTLTLAGLADFDIDKTGLTLTNDKVTNLTAAPNITGATLNLTITGSGFAAGNTWDLFDWAGGGSMNGTIGTAPTSVPSGFAWHNFGSPGSPNYINPATGEIQLDVGQTATIWKDTTARYTNRADNNDGSGNPDSTVSGKVHVQGSSGKYISEIDGLTDGTSNAVHAFADGSVQHDLGDGVANPTLVMLWLSGDPDKIAQVVNQLDTEAQRNSGGYDIALSNVGDTDLLYNDILELKKHYIPGSDTDDFNVLVKFNSAMTSSEYFSWSFTGDWGAVKVDQIAIVPEPATIAGVLGLGAMAMLRRRRRARR
jgi:autotransporter-associated beta strand protein